MLAAQTRARQLAALVLCSPASFNDEPLPSLPQPLIPNSIPNSPEPDKELVSADQSPDTIQSERMKIKIQHPLFIFINSL